MSSFSNQSMNSRQRIQRATMLVFAGSASGRMFAMLSSMQLAWVLSKADFGIGATLWLTVTLLTMLSELGVDRLLVQADEGDDEHFNAVAQAISVIRGIACGAAVAAAAYPTALLFDQPELAWAFAAAGLTPVIDGFKHRDVSRMERHLRFAPAAISVAAPEAIACCLAYPLCLWIGDFRVFLVLSLGKNLMTMVLTHVMAERPFRLSWDRAIARRFFVFGLPLAANGALMYASLQGDRFIVAASFSPDQVGDYAVASTFTFHVGFLIAGAANRIGLPMLAQHKRSRAAFLRLFDTFNSTLIFCGGAFAVAGIMLSPWIIRFLYGAKYADVAPLFAWITAAQSLRLLPIAPILGCLAFGDTTSALIVNVIKTTVFLATWALIVPHTDLMWLAVAAVAGEVASMIAAWRLARRRFSMPLATSVVGAGAVSALIALALAVHLSSSTSEVSIQTVGPVLLGLILAILLLGAALAMVSPGMRGEVTTLLGSIKGSRISSERQEGIAAPVNQ
jgi:O-antigen/teichoic acid export membrane protein